MTIEEASLKSMLLTAVSLGTNEFYSLEPRTKKAISSINGLLAEHAMLGDSQLWQLPELLGLIKANDGSAVTSARVTELRLQPLVAFKLRLHAWRDRCLKATSADAAVFELRQLAAEYWENYPGTEKAD